MGLSQGAARATALTELPFDCGLDPASLLTADVVSEPFAPRGGSIPVGRLVPDGALLDAHAASPERRDWWRDRIARCHAVLAARA